MCDVQVQSAQNAVQQCSGQITGNSCLDMRWYLPEAPSTTSHMQMLPDLHSRHQAFPPRSSTAAAFEPDLLEQSGSLKTSTALGKISGRAMDQLHSRKLWGTGTALRVLLSCMLLWGYVILLISGY